MTTHRRRHTALAAFTVALLIYAATRLIGLTRYPIYFFSDEAIQTVAAADLLREHFRNSDGLLWPPYFKNFAVWNLSLSVYLQMLPLRLLGMSVYVTRWVSVMVGMLGVAAVAGTLRNVFRARGWYLSVLVLAATPAWFLHSRTAFETAEMTAFYALFLYCYLLYRTRAPRFIFPALVFAAAAFYSYSNGQAIIGVLVLALAIVDAPYHWRVAQGGRGEREQGGDGAGESTRSSRLPFSLWPLLLFLALAVLLAWPYVRFRQAYPTDLTYHLRSLNSYWFNDTSTAVKLGEFADRYLYALSPRYWFRPGDYDLARHRMGPSLGHMRLVFLPLLILGLVVALGRLWDALAEKRARRAAAAEFGAIEGQPTLATAAAVRAVLLSLLAVPVGAALVDVAITRVLATVVPATLLIGLGIDWLMRLDTKNEIRNTSEERISLLVSRLSSLVFLLLSLMSLGLLRYALADGPTWFTDYGMGGMQYGASQLFEVIEARLAADPDAQIMLSPDWANGTSIFAPFFLSADDQRRVQTLNVDAFISQKRLLTPDMLFIMLPGEVERALGSGKFATVDVEDTIFYPDGRPGFLLARLAYAPDIDAVFAAELEALRQPVTETGTLDGAPVTVTHTRFEAGQLADLFDGDAFTLVRHIAGNPVRYEIVFDAPRPVGGLAADFGTMDFALTVTLTPPGGAPVDYEQEFRGLDPDPHITMPFPDAPPLVSSLTLAIRDLNAGEDVKIHVRELGVTSDE